MRLMMVQLRADATVEVGDIVHDYEERLFADGRIGLRGMVAQRMTDGRNHPLPDEPIGPLDYLSPPHTGRPTHLRQPHDGDWQCGPQGGEQILEVARHPYGTELRNARAPWIREHRVEGRPRQNRRPAVVARRQRRPSPGRLRGDDAVPHCDRRLGQSAHDPRTRRPDRRRNLGRLPEGIRAPVYVRLERVVGLQRGQRRVAAETDR